MESKERGGGDHEQEAWVTTNVMQGKMHDLTCHLDFLLSYLYTDDNLVCACILLEVIQNLSAHTSDTVV